MKTRRSALIGLIAGCLLMAHGGCPVGGPGVDGNVNENGTSGNGNDNGTDSNGNGNGNGANTNGNTNGNGPTSIRNARLIVDDPASEVAEILVTPNGYQVAVLAAKDEAGDPLWATGVVIVEPDGTNLALRFADSGYLETITLGDYVVLLDEDVESYTLFEPDGSRTTGLLADFPDDWTRYILPLAALADDGFVGSYSKGGAPKLQANRLKVKSSTLWRIAGLGLGTAKCVLGIQAILSGVAAPVGALAAVSCITTGLQIVDLFIDIDDGGLAVVGGAMNLASCAQNVIEVTPRNLLRARS